MDVNQNGYLSLAEIDKGFKDALKVKDIFYAKKALIRAFNASKDYAPDAENYLAQDYI